MCGTLMSRSWVLLQFKHRCVIRTWSTELKRQTHLVFLYPLPINPSLNDSNQYTLENSVGNRENADTKQFLMFSQCVHIIFNTSHT